MPPLYLLISIYIICIRIICSDSEGGGTTVQQMLQEEISPIFFNGNTSERILSLIPSIFPPDIYLAVLSIVQQHHITILISFVVPDNFKEKCFAFVFVQGTLAIMYVFVDKQC